MTRLNPAQFRYLQEVLGVEQVLWGPLPEVSPESDVTVRVATQEGAFPKVLALVDKLHDEEKNLLSRMLQAMQLSDADYKILEQPDLASLEELLKKRPSLVLVFGESVAKKLNLQIQKGKFHDLQGIASVLTYAPAELLAEPALKAEAWQDLKLAMRRLS